MVNSGFQRLSRAARSLTFRGIMIPLYYESAGGLILSETITFRATDALAGAIQDKAVDAGLTVSSYIREIVSTSLADDATPPARALAMSRVQRGVLTPYPSDPCILSRPIA